MGVGSKLLLRSCVGVQVHFYISLWALSVRLLFFSSVVLFIGPCRSARLASSRHIGTYDDVNRPHREREIYFPPHVTQSNIPRRVMITTKI